MLLYSSTKVFSKFGKHLRFWRQISYKTKNMFFNQNRLNKAVDVNITADINVAFRRWNQLHWTVANPLPSHHILCIATRLCKGT